MIASPSNSDVRQISTLLRGQPEHIAASYRGLDAIRAVVDGAAHNTTDLAKLYSRRFPRRISNNFE